MALTVSNLHKSPRFLSKYLKIYPPSTVICYTHSQLAIQPCNAQKPCIFVLHKENRSRLKGTSEKKSKDVDRQLYFPASRKKTVFQKSQTFEAVNALWKSIGPLDLHEKAQNNSLLKQWNCDPLMDNKQLVLIIFEQDKITGKASFLHKGTLLNSTAEEKKTLPKLSLENLENKQTVSDSNDIPMVTTQQMSQLHQTNENHQQVFQTSHSGCLQRDLISEAAKLFADISEDTKSPSKKKVLKTGPDPTQLSSVLLDLRDEIPEFFLKKPSYSIYHQRVKFVNNIMGTTTHGIYPYRAQISGLRLMILSCMTELSMEVLKITKHPNEGTIKVRWRIKGIPLLRKAVPFIGRRLKASSEGYRYLDGFSVFEVGTDGLIHCHRLHKVMPSSSPEKENALWIMFLLPFIHLLDPKSCETFGAFECCITDKDIEPASTEAADTIAELLHQLSATDLKLKPKCS